MKRWKGEGVRAEMEQGEARKKRESLQRWRRENGPEWEDLNGGRMRGAGAGGLGGWGARRQAVRVSGQGSGAGGWYVARG